MADSRGGSSSFYALLMLPGGNVEGSGPQRPNDPDLREPWVALVKTATDAAGRGRTECIGFSNPASASYEGAAIGRVPSMFADVKCDDGLGYEFYRLHWRGTEPIEFGPAQSTVPRGPFQKWWRSVYVFDRPHYAGGVEWSTLRHDNVSAAKFAICGHRDREVDCLVPERQSDPWQYGAIHGGWLSIRSHAGLHERTYCC